MAVKKRDASVLFALLESNPVYDVDALDCAPLCGGVRGRGGGAVGAISAMKNHDENFELWSSFMGFNDC